MSLEDTTATDIKSPLRSARVRDPIVAPGFGTQRDLEKLAQDLGQPTEVVQAVMSSQGRGYRRRGSKEADDATESKPKVANTAWADFMMEAKEEDKPKEDAEDNKKRSRRSTGGNNQESQPAESTTTTTTSKIRTYDLSSLKCDDNKSKKSKTSAGDCGVLVQAGTLDASSVGRTKVSASQQRSFDLSLPSLIPVRNILFRQVISSCNAAHALAIDSNGNLYGWGRNESQQLGMAASACVSRPFLLEVPSSSGKIVSGAVGKNHSMVLDSSGELYAVGGNKVGQCGVKLNADLIPQWKACVGFDSNVAQVACGEAFSIALDEHGYMYTAGSSEFGQTGTGETGEYFVSANKLAFANSIQFQKQQGFCSMGPAESIYRADNSLKKSPLDDALQIRLSSIACGKHHAVAIEAPASGNGHTPRVFTWGCGNYGCLGHGVQADEYTPRSIALFEQQDSVFANNPPVSAAAGASCSMVLTKSGHVYYWGKHKSNAEAVMRPQLLNELAHNGHIASHVAGGNQSVMVTTQNAVTVAWGQGPHGELALGKVKSSSKPTFVSALDACRCVSLACGYGNTYWIVQKEDADDEKAIEQLETVTDEAFMDLEAAVVSAKSTKK
mmetsp:Transcript_10270/g.15078  ORF Transcript_10270/g.15078 Transcript_10270/m.15078 type:complete len:612 (+) Transcript_10270:116-1951(+)